MTAALPPAQPTMVSSSLTLLFPPLLLSASSAQLDSSSTPPQDNASAKLDSTQSLRLSPMNLHASLALLPSARPVNRPLEMSATPALLEPPSMSQLLSVSAMLASSRMEPSALPAPASVVHAQLPLFVLVALMLLQEMSTITASVLMVSMKLEPLFAQLAQLSA